MDARQTPNVSLVCGDAVAFEIFEILFERQKFHTTFILLLLLLLLFCKNLVSYELVFLLSPDSELTGPER